MKSFSEYLQLNEQEQLNETLYGSWDDFVELSNRHKDNFWNTIPVTNNERMQIRSSGYFDMANGVSPYRFAGIIKPRKGSSFLYTLESLTPEEQAEFGPDVYRAWSIVHNTPATLYKLDFGSYRVRSLDMKVYEASNKVKWERAFKPDYLVLLIER